MQFAVVFGGVIIVALLYGASTSTAAFGAYNTAWDGTADLRTLADTTETPTRLAQNTTAYTELPAEQTVALVLAPDQAYQSGDKERISAFVRAGGTLVVADERAQPTNDLLAGVGADAHIDGTPLRDERRYYRDPAAPIVRNLSTQPPLTNVSALTLNHGTAVEPGNATVQARTSGYAYLDTNGNQNLDDTETVTDYPVLTTEQVGQGRVIVIGDASLFINNMLARSGNQQFAHNLLTTHNHLLLDYSHTATLPPLIQAMLLFRQTPILRFIGGAFGVLILAVLYTHPNSLPTLTSSPP